MLCAVSAAYPAVLTLHSWLRWLVLAMLLCMGLRALLGWLRRREFTAFDARLGLFASLCVDLQFVLGLSLYLRLSPITRAAFADLAAAMRLSVLRFFLVEHGTGMLLGIGILHMLRSRARRRQGPARHALTAVAALGALLCIALSVPWPGLPYGRPLWRLPP